MLKHIIEACAFILMLISTLVRMTALADAPVYRENALMTADFYALGAALFIFGLFNLIFVGGFFKTAYKLGRPFVTYIIITFLVIAAAEALPHIRGFEWLNTFGTDHMGIQMLLLLAGFLAFVLLTVLSCGKHVMILREQIFEVWSDYAER